LDILAQTNKIDKLVF